jgi:nitrogen fixation/metabolism regulation signal transduction histidine kinase
MTPGAARPNRRRQLIVNRPLQYRFIGAMLLILLVLSGIGLATVYVTLWTTLRTFGLERDTVAVALFTTVGWSLTLELLIVAPFVIWMGVLLTHKVAGPLVRIQAALTRMTNGNYDVHLQLRKPDALKELAEGINRLAASLRAPR